MNYSTISNLLFSMDFFAFIGLSIQLIFINCYTPAMTNRQLEHSDHTTKNIKFPLSIIANDLEVPTNVGSLFRLCDALGVERLYLTGNTVVPHNRKISKTSRSTEKYVDYTCEDSAESVINRLKDGGYTIISLEITADSVDLRSLDYSSFGKICLVVGSESTGVNQALLGLSDYCIHIPMLGQNSSMNVVTATGIAVYEITSAGVNFQG